jgi:hypothetical protein
MTQTETNYAWEFARFSYHLDDMGDTRGYYPMAMDFLKSQLAFCSPDKMVGLLQRIKNDCQNIQDGLTPQMLRPSESKVALLLLAIRELEAKLEAKSDI